MISTETTPGETSGSIEFSPAGDAPETLSPAVLSETPDPAAQGSEADAPASAAPRETARRSRRPASRTRKKTAPTAAGQTPENTLSPAANDEDAHPDPEAGGVPARPKPRRRAARRSAPATAGDTPADAVMPLPDTEQPAARPDPADAEAPAPHAAEPAAGVDPSLTEGPFTFSDELDEEAPAAGKRRRSRRGGRGRKRPAEQHDASAPAALPDGNAAGGEASGDASPDACEDGSNAASGPEALPGAPEVLSEMLPEILSEDALAARAPEETPPSPERDEDPASPPPGTAESGEAGPETPAEEAAVRENAEDAEEEAVAARKKGRVREKAEAESRAKLPPRGLMKMLISVLPGDEVEVVLTEDGKVREYYVEMMHHAKIRGNIYKGVISNVDANLQAAFVNYGAVKNGFLQIDEVHPDYYLQPHEAGKGHRYPPIQKALKAGQEVLVQVVKEPNGSKGAFLTTWISLAGRFLVLTPGQEEIGISRKVEDTAERNRLRELIKGLNPGQGLGAIVRTVSAGTSKTTLQKDLSYLKRLWKDIRKRGATEKAPALIHQEPGLASRAVRDYLAEDITEVWVDDEETAVSIRETAAMLFPRKTDLVHLYEDHRETLWERFGIVKQLEQVHAREVYMPSGGRLVFDQTEALMAIDINSGRISGKNNFEAMAFRTNMEAATTIAEQLRLRDIGGQIVIDFIEMRDPEHCREVEKTLRNAMRWDRARHDIGKMSSFGLLQIVRQRTGSSAISITLEPCPHCGGTGQRRNLEWRAVQTLRDLQRAARAAAGSGQGVCVHAVEPELGLYLLNHKRERLTQLEQRFGIAVEVRIAGFAEAPGQKGQPAPGGQNGGRPGQNQGQQNRTDKAPGGEKEGRQNRKAGRRGKTEAPGTETSGTEAPASEMPASPPASALASAPASDTRSPSPRQEVTAGASPETGSETGPEAGHSGQDAKEPTAPDTAERPETAESGKPRAGRRRSSGGRARKPRRSAAGSASGPAVSDGGQDIGSGSGAEPDVRPAVAPAGKAGDRNQDGGAGAPVVMEAAS